MLNAKIDIFHLIEKVVPVKSFDPSIENKRLSLIQGSKLLNSHSNELLNILCEINSNIFIFFFDHQQRKGNVSRDANRVEHIHEMQG